jgi:SAM-dependent methyltransferase
VLRSLELGTERYLLGPARAIEAQAQDAVELETERRAVRDALRSIWSRGQLGYEVTHWPSGPGSARALSLIYNNSPQTHDVASHYTEAFLLSRDLAHAVRSRGDVLRDQLVAELNVKIEPMKVLDLGCGPCQSLRQALPLLVGPKRLHVRAIDTDELAQINNRVHFQQGHSLDWQFDLGHVLKASLEPDTYDVAYATGLYDYLPARVLAQLWQRVYDALKPGGLAIICVKDGERFCPLFYRWAIDWSQFYIRSAADFRKILANTNLPAPEQELRDATGCILFYLVRKPR